MADLIKIRGMKSNYVPLGINFLLIVFSAASMLTAISFWQREQSHYTQSALCFSLACAVAADTANRFSKDEVAIARLKSDAELRLLARLVSAQELTQVVDLDRASAEQLSKLRIDKAAADAQMSVSMAELEVEHDNALAQLEEFIVSSRDS